MTRDTEHFVKIPKNKISELSQYPFYKVVNINVGNPDLKMKCYTNISIDKLRSRSKYLCCMHKPRIAIISINGKFTQSGINLLNHSTNIIGNLITVRLGLGRKINYYKSADIGIVILGKNEAYNPRTLSFVKQYSQRIAKYLIIVVISTGKTDNLISNPEISTHIMKYIDSNYHEKVLVFTFSKKPSEIQKMAIKNIIIQYNRAFNLNSNELEKYSRGVLRLYNQSFKS